MDNLAQFGEKALKYLTTDFYVFCAQSKCIQGRSCPTKQIKLNW
jgi:hypothetical protein